MSEDASTGTESGNASEGTPPAAPEQPTKTTEWYESELARVRNEAASNRVKGNEKAEAARTQVTQEFEAKLAESSTAHETTKSKLSQAEAKIAKLSVALKSGVSVDKVEAFAGLLQGNTAEELTAHAETLKSLFGSTSGEPAVDPSQGRGDETSGSDPDVAFAAWIQSQLN